jgi:hydroxyacylglutathione hydrolase
MKIPPKYNTWNTKNGYQIIQILSGRSNVFLLTYGEKNILIDTGPKRLWKKLEKNLNNVNIAHIDYLILTHSHFDHAGNAKKIKEKYSTQVIIHRSEASYLAAGDFVIPKGTIPITRLIVNMLAKRFAYRFKFEPCHHDILVDARFELNVFGLNAYILHTPGHTFGSMSVIIDDELALVGDAMFGIFKWSVFPPYAQDVKQMIYSWGKLLETNCATFIPSHGTANRRSLVLKEYNIRK